MPSAREMLRLIARDPVAQARFFILSMRLFLQHVLGTGPFDDQLRHNDRFEGPFVPRWVRSVWARRGVWHAGRVARAYRGAGSALDTITSSCGSSTLNLSSGSEAF